MPLQQTSGNVTQDAYGGGVAVAPVYIEDVMSTFLYTGSGSTQTINNGIDLSGKGGLVWCKDRSGTGNGHILIDSARPLSQFLQTDNIFVGNNSSVITSLNSNGFTLGASGNANQNAATYASWTFRKQPKFFDVVTYTGNGANRTIAHALGSTPGCIIVKRTDTTGNWQVYHNSLTSAAYGIQINLTNAQASNTTLWNSTAPTTSAFSVGTNADVNASGGTYVAYIFAHNAGGFGLSGTDNVISCGSYAGNGSGNGPTITLGYEPQFIMLKRTDSAANWYVIDTMRGMTVDLVDDKYLCPNLSDAENGTNILEPLATGFKLNSAGGAGFNASGGTYIYIAIRRGPMKVPTDGTKVFMPIAVNAATGTAQTTSFVIDSQWKAKRSTDSLNTSVDDRLRGVSTTSSASGNYLITSGTAVEATANATTQFWNNTGFQIPTYYGSASDIFYSFGRAPSFFDEVCYTGGGSTTKPHNLGVVPELMLIKQRDIADNWMVYQSSIGTSLSLQLNSNSWGFGGVWNNTAPTSSVFSVSSSANTGGGLYVAYLFATCPGVSKVGSYTGNGTTQTINCGFTGGARFVLIKRTDSTGDWYVYDTARGMTTLTDPYLLLNSTAAESATLGSVTTVTTGFALNASILAAINTNGASYIFLAIA